jgi:YesN/AraC family two-component response regulator
MQGHNHFCKIFPGENYVDLTIFQFGHEKCEALHSFGPAVRNHFLFHYILSGKGTLCSTNDKGADTVYRLESEQGFLIYPGQQNSYFADENEPWEYMWVEFEGMKANELVMQSGLTFNQPVYISQMPTMREKMKDELLYMATYANHPTLELMGHFYLFFSALIDSSSQRKKVSGGNLRDFYIREVIDFIERHYQEDITVEDIAFSCNLDRSYLGKIFKSKMNVSPQDFLISFRMNKACELMKITDHAIGEICEMVGYQNMFNFSRVFKQVIGKPPGKWRTENKLR